LPHVYQAQAHALCNAGKKAASAAAAAKANGQQEDAAGTEAAGGGAAGGRAAGAGTGAGGAAGTAGVWRLRAKGAQLDARVGVCVSAWVMYLRVGKSLQVHMRSCMHLHMYTQAGLPTPPGGHAPLCAHVYKHARAYVHL